MAASTNAKPPTSRSPITITAIFSTRTWRGVNTVPGKGVLSGSLAAICLVVADSAPKADNALCETCKSEVVQHCTAKAKQYDWKKKKLNQCISEVGKACKESCKNKEDKKEEKKSSTPETPGAEEKDKSSTSETPPAARIEDNPCYIYCSNQCGGPNHDACVLSCVASTKCTPPSQ